MSRRNAGGAIVIASALVLGGCAFDLPSLLAASRSTPASSSDLEGSDSGGGHSVRGDLAVKGKAPKTGYSRAQFGQAWSDDVSVCLGHNGCDTRNDILRRDLTQVAIKPRTHGCVVLAGTLHDPYSGSTISFQRGSSSSSSVQIDHIISLSNAWQTGAQSWTPQKRRDFANDPRNLLAVDGPTNQAKGDGDAATWLPPSKSYRCQYVTQQVTVKRAYGLWVTPAESAAIQLVLTRC